MFPFLFQALRSAGVQVNSGGGAALRSPIATASSRSNNTNTNLNSSFRKKAVGSSPSNKKVSFSEPLSSPPPLLELLDKAFLDDDEEEEEEKESEEQEEEDDSANKSVSSPSDTLNIAFETAKEEEDCEKNDNADHSDLLRALESANLALVGDAKAVSGQDLARDSSPSQSSPSSSNPSRASSLPSSPEVSVYELPRDKEPGKKTDSGGSNNSNNNNNNSNNNSNGLGKLRSIFGGRDSSIGDSSSLIGDRLKSLFGGSQQQQPVYQLTVEPKRDSEVKEKDSFETKVQGEEDSFERHEREFLEESRLAREEEEESEKKGNEKAGRLEVDVGGSRVRFFSGEDKSSSGEEESSDDANAAVNVYRVSETSGSNKSVILSGNLEGVAEKKVEALEDVLHEKDEEEEDKSGGGFREVVVKDGEDSRFISGNIVVRYKK